MNLANPIQTRYSLRALNIVGERTNQSSEPEESMQISAKRRNIEKGDGDAGQPQQSAGNKRLQQTQAQVDEVVGIMRVNVEKVLERDQKLSELDDRAVLLED